MKLGAFLVVSTLFATGAHADCSGVRHRDAQATIDAVSLPLFDAAGQEIKGCLLHSNGKVLGYSTDDALCGITKPTHVKMRLTYGCCDTGGDQGDIECIVRSHSSSATAAAHGNGVVVSLTGAT